MATTSCRRCGRSIKFVMHNGKWHPMTPDGISPHWTECDRQRSSDVEIERGKWIKGDKYVEIKCECLPWEGCPACREKIRQLSLDFGHQNKGTSPSLPFKATFRR